MQSVGQTVAFINSRPIASMNLADRLARFPVRLSFYIAWSQEVAIWEPNRALHL